MANPTCVKCGSGNFEVVKTELEGTPTSYSFIQCSDCGGVVGATEFTSLRTIRSLERTIADVERKVRNVESIVSSIKRASG